MVLASQLTFGMTIIVVKKPYRVENAVKVSSKGAQFIKVKLRHLHTDEVIEKNFKPNQDLSEVSLEEHSLEYLYQENKEYIFLDLNTLDIIKVSSEVVGDKVEYLKEGTEIKGSCYGSDIYSVELPQFLELMVAAIDDSEEGEARLAELETGAQLEVPLFVDVGDIIKVDARLKEYIQRV